MVSLGKAVGRTRARAEQPGVGDRTQRGAARGSAATRPSRRRALLGAAQLTDAQLAAIDAVRTSCLAIARRRRALADPAGRARGRDRRLARRRTASTPRIAAPLAETAVTLDALDRIAGAVSGPPLDAVLRWAAAGCSVRELASEIQDAAMRISGLVTAIKGFTHMDQATVAEPVDLASSLAQHGRRPQMRRRGRNRSP